MDPDRLRLGGESREISVFFADIRDFTAFSERHTPDVVVALLNAYYGVVIPRIEAEGGVINQFMGDGMMVLFGAIPDRPDHAARAFARPCRPSGRSKTINSSGRRWGLTGCGLESGFIRARCCSAPSVRRRGWISRPSATRSTPPRASRARTSAVGSSILITQRNTGGRAARPANPARYP